MVKQGRFKQGSLCHNTWKSLSNRFTWGCLMLPVVLKRQQPTAVTASCLGERSSTYWGGMGHGAIQTSEGGRKKSKSTQQGPIIEAFCALKLIFSSLSRSRSPSRIKINDSIETLFCQLRGSRRRNVFSGTAGNTAALIIPFYLLLPSSYFGEIGWAVVPQTSSASHPHQEMSVNCWSC